MGRPERMQRALIVDYLLGHLDESAAGELDERLRHDTGLAEECAAVAETLADLSELTTGHRRSGTLRERVLGSVSPGHRLEGFARRLGRLFDLDDAATRALLANAARGPDSRWLPYGRPGVRALPVTCGPTLSGALGALVHLERGANLPPHRHGGEEQMLVLDGYARESAGREVAPGDLVTSAAGTAHSFEILEDSPCLFACTVAGKIEWVDD